EDPRDGPQALEGLGLPARPAGRAGADRQGPEAGVRRRRPPEGDEGGAPRPPPAGLLDRAAEEARPRGSPAGGGGARPELGRASQSGRAGSRGWRGSSRSSLPARSP